LCIFVFLWFVAHPTVVKHGIQECMYTNNWVLNIFHPRAFGKLNTFLFICIYSLDGGLHQLKTCSLYKLMVLVNVVNAYILLLNTPLLLLFFAKARAYSSSVAMQPPKGAHVHIKHNVCKSQNMLHILTWTILPCEGFRIKAT
jgi:hypothetical protein